MPSNHFDEGIVIAEGGYNWPLSQWGNYYFTNVIGTHALTHAQFAKEFPQVTEALLASDAKLREEKEAQARITMMLNDPRIAGVLPEIVTHLASGGSITLEAFPPAGSPPLAQTRPMPMGQQMAQPGAPPQAPAPAPGQQQQDSHTHQLQVDTEGNGQTDAHPVDGHVHPVRGNQILAQGGHTHDVAQMQMQQNQQVAPGQQVAPPANPAQPGNGG